MKFVASLLDKKLCKMNLISSFVIFASIFDLREATNPPVGTSCPASNSCPDKYACIMKGASVICICRLAHKKDDGTWAPGWESCTDDYSPLSLFPYENNTALQNPIVEFETLPDFAITDKISSPKATFARLRYSFAGGKEWCGAYLQIDLGVVSTISMIATQGVGSFVKATKVFSIESSDDASTWAPQGTYTGNDDAKTIIYNFFDPPIKNRHIRVNPLEKKVDYCLRMELYGNKVMNECNTPEWSKCDKNAKCTDTQGGYWCECLKGYDDKSTDNRVGITCGQVNECLDSDPKHNCSEFATCTDTMGSFQCSCFEGYVGDGYYCEDINECEVHKLADPPICKKNAKCVNVPGEFECECLSGYKGSDPKVEDCNNINECVTGDKNCHTDAKCTDVDGSFLCTCFKGFIGNGTYCQDDDECLGNPCHNDAYCANTKGSFICRCSQGFVGSGFWCDDEDECLSNPCKADEYCFNTRGGFECMCPKVMPLQFSYKELEQTVLANVLQNFRDSTKEDWRFPLDHHAHIIRTLYQLVMRTYNYHFIETRDPFYIVHVAGDSFAVELYDLRCKDAANVTFPSLCHGGYNKTEFQFFSDIVEMWLVREPNVPFENWATTPKPVPPDPKAVRTTLPPLITERPLTEIVVTNQNGTNITLTEQPQTTRLPYTKCGWIFNNSLTYPETFHTPFYPQSYPPKSECIWELEAPERQNVFVEFLIGGDDVFEMELDKKCSYDYVTIRDDSISGPVLATYCGNDKNQYPRAVRSSREKLVVIFRSDIYYEYRGFKARWGILEPRVSIGCITYNQMSTMPKSFQRQWAIEMEGQDSSKYTPVSRLMACRQYPKCKNARPGPIMFTFEHFRVDRNDKYCISWDLDTIGTTYSTDRCVKEMTNKTHTVCKCSGWGIVGVLGRFVTEKVKVKITKFEFGRNSFWSVLLVTLMLVGTFFYVLLKDQWGAVIVEVFKRKELDSGRIIQMHIVMGALLSEFFFFIISFEVKGTAGSCYFLTFLFYYFLQTVFFWLFIYTLFLQSRVQEIFDSSKFNTYHIYLFLGYVVPFVVTLTIIGLDFNTVEGNTLCWLMFEGTKAWGLSGVIATLGVGTLIILSHIIYKSQYMENGLILQEKCLKTMFTVFFVLMTSAFGARALETKTFGAQYVFSLCNLLQGSSITVMYCILRREDPVIKANQVGPLPDFETEEKYDGSSSTDDERKDMSEAPSSESEDENEINESNLKSYRSSAVILNMKSESLPDVNSLSSNLSSDVDSSSDDRSDDEIHFRSDDLNNYKVR